MATLERQTKQQQPQPTSKDTSGSLPPSSDNTQHFQQQKFLRTTHVGQLIFDQKKLIKVNSKCTVEELSDLLSQHNILTVPVWDESKSVFIGTVGVFDIVALLAFGMHREKKPKESPHTPTTNFLETEYSNMTVKELMETVDSWEPKTDRRCIYTLDPSDSLLCLLRPFGTTTIHRVLVHLGKTPPFEAPYRLLSQSDVNRFLCENISELDPELIHSSLEDLGITKGSVHSVSESEIAATAFQKLHVLQHCSALAVVDSQGKLTGTLSASDVRSLKVDQLHIIGNSCKDFLSAVSRINNSKPSHQATCKTSTSLEEVMKTLAKEKIHRVWIVDDENKPTGVVSLSDIIRLFLASKYFSS